MNITTKKKIKKMHAEMKNAIKALAFFICAEIGCCSLFATSPEANRDVKFCQLLNDYGLYQFSERFIEVRTQENPEDKNIYKVQQADTQLAQNKYEEAKKLIDSIPKDIPEFYDGAGALGIYYFRRQENEKAKQYLESMYDYLKKTNAVPSEHERALAALLNIYYGTGEDEKAQKLLEWTQQNQDVDRRAAEYTKQFLRLNAAIRKQQAEQRELDLFQHKLEEGLNNKKISKELSSLNKKAEDENKQLLRGKGNRDERDKAYKKMGELLDFDVNTIIQIRNAEITRNERNAKIKNRAHINKNELAQLKNSKEEDWNSMVISACLSFFEMEWGGQNALTAYAAAQSIRCLYLLGLYDDALGEANKYSELFDLTDNAMQEAKKLSESPSADAKYWAGKSAQAAADSLYDQIKTNADKKKEAVSYYTKAFKYLGKLSKYYTSYEEINDAYECFSLVTDRLCELNPSKRNTYRTEFNTVKKPKMKKEKTLVTDLMRQNFEGKLFDMVIEEALDTLSQSPNIKVKDYTEFMNKLILSYAFSGDSLHATIFANYLINTSKQDDFVSVALMNAGHLAWDAASKAEDPDMAAQYKSDALILYNYFLSVDLMNQMSGIVALRIARDKLNSIAEYGNRLNAEKNQDIRTQLKKEWSQAIEDTISAYQMIMNNFGSNKELVCEAYIRIGDCYILQERTEEAVSILEKYLNLYGNDNLDIAAVAKENISEMLAKRGSKIKAGIEDLIDSGIAENDEKIKSMRKEIIDTYLKGVNNMQDFLQEIKNGKYKSIESHDVFKKTVTRAYALLPWLYDGAEKREDAIREFEHFIELYPKDKLAAPYLMRIGVLKIETNDQEGAQKTLTKLMADYPKSAEAKNARYFLAKNLYNAGNIASALSLLEDIVKSPENQKTLTISNMRWISENLPKCKEKSLAKRASTLAGQVSALLLQKLSDPDLSEWFSAERAAELAADKNKQKKALGLIEQKILLDSGLAAAGAGQFDKAADFISRVEVIDANTPYYYELHFSMSEILTLQEKHDEARKELAKISTRSNQLNDFTTYNKAQVLMGESFLRENAINKANSCFSIVALSVSSNEDTEENKTGNEDNPEFMVYAELGVYHYALTLSQLGKNEERDNIIKLYQKKWPQGKYLKELENPPSSITQ